MIGLVSKIMIDDGKTYIRHHISEPCIFPNQLLEPHASHTVLILISPINHRVLKMDAGFWFLFTDALQLGPRCSLKFLEGGTGCPDGEVIGAGPG